MGLPQHAHISNELAHKLLYVFVLSGAVLSDLCSLFLFFVILLIEHESLVGHDMERHHFRVCGPDKCAFLEFNLDRTEL